MLVEIVAKKHIKISLDIKLLLKSKYNKLGYIIGITDVGNDIILIKKVSLIEVKELKVFFVKMGFTFNVFQIGYFQTTYKTF